MSLRFISVLATDKVTLPGLLYEPSEKTPKIALWLHGMGDSGVFYKPTLINALGNALTEKNVAFLALNNRGAHNSKRLSIADKTLPEEDQSFQGGTYYEKIVDCVKDINGTVDFLKEQGYSELYLLGHSTGANKICAYHVRQPNSPFSKYVLAGPGDDVGLFFQELGAKRFWQALNYAASKLEQDPLHTMPKYTGMNPFSVQSAWDILNPDGSYNTFPFYECTSERLGSKPLFQEYQTIDSKTLVIIGEEDEYMSTAGGTKGALELFMRHTSNQRLKYTDFVTVPGADHSFHGYEDVFAKQVSDWLAYD